MSPEPDDRADRFLRLSAALTGYGTFDLLGTGVAGEYLRTLEAILPADVLDDLLAAADDGVLDDPTLGPVARNVILMWYCGTWAQLPDDWRAAHGASPRDTRHVVSGAAYLSGLQWVVADAHPSGGLQQGFGAWAGPPAGGSR